MPPTLRLTLTDYIDATRWRWVLSDDTGAFVADHEVHLDPAGREYQGFVDLGDYLDYHQPIHPPEYQLRELGVWIGERVFGGLRDALWQRRATPAVAVQVVVPATAKDLLLLPFDLACFADSKPFWQAGVRFVYELEESSPRVETKEPVGKTLRILAAFSLPVSTNPLNLRRERHGLQQLVRELSQAQGLAIELRVLQYGATQGTLKAALEEAEGWDIIHLSGHGERGELLLEDDRGGSDTFDTEKLGGLFDPARARIKLLILDTCYSGAGSHAAARVQVGLDDAPVRQEGTVGEAVAGTAGTARTTLPSLAQTLSQRLYCAALAMRYPVGDAFATELMLALYQKLLDRQQPLPGALHLALDEALGADIPKPPLSPVTPILVGERAAGLQLAPPLRPREPIGLPVVGLGIAFPPEPERFVGRLQPLLRASQTLAPGSAKRGVLFYGMPGAGKTACALELTYRHERDRFTGYVWHRAPEAGSEIASALFNLMQDIQTQLDAPDLGLTTALDDPAHFRTYTLPRLSALLQERSLLLVLDNLETLLTKSHNWRDPLWGELVNALLDHEGLSRVLLTSRRQPADLAEHPRLQIEAIHALSFAESVLLARELPHLNSLFDDEAGRALLRDTLRVVQGHPKLLELADSLATDRVALEQRVAAAADELGDRADVLDIFFALDHPHEGETRQSETAFAQELRRWTAGVAGNLTPTADLLFVFLSRMEPADRAPDIIQANWEGLLNRLGEGHVAAMAARAGPGLAAGLSALKAAGLAALESATTTYTIHPGVAEAARGAAEGAVLDAADIELGNFHIVRLKQSLKREHEMEGGGKTVLECARRAIPYLLRQARWEAASYALHTMLEREYSPANLAFALPLLSRIVEATAGTEKGFENASTLAKNLWMAGRSKEAEPMLRKLIDQSVTQSNYHLASKVAGNLSQLLMTSSRLKEALVVTNETAGYIRRAGLGPWTQLQNKGTRLQVLAAMGKYHEVLEEVERLRPEMEALPTESEADETALPWSVREGLLQTGSIAASGCGQFQTAIALNAEIQNSEQARDAGALEMARTRFNDYDSLLRLRRFDEARTLLQSCREVYEAERAIASLGNVYGALADLEYETGNLDTAVRFEEVAISYAYQADRPIDCARSHNNLAWKLRGANSAAALAHNLAAAAIRYQTSSGEFDQSIAILAISDLPPIPPPFSEVAERVESVTGVRFRELFKHLPRAATDGDAVLAVVWQEVAAKKQQSGEARQAREAVLATLPAAIQTAYELEGDDFNEALRDALAALPNAEAEVIVQQLSEAGLIGTLDDRDVALVLREFEWLLQNIAAAVTEQSLRGQIEPVLVDMEKNGLNLTEAVHRIWAGERDSEALTVGLNVQGIVMVRDVLHRL